MFMWIVNETKNRKDEYHENVAVLRWKSLTDSAVLFLDYCIIRQANKMEQDLPLNQNVKIQNQKRKKAVKDGIKKVIEFSFRVK